MKIVEREKAIQLRNKGLAFSDIRNQIKVSKSTLSYWLRAIPYTPTAAVSDRRRLASIQNGQVLRKRKMERVGGIKNEAKQEIEKIGLAELQLLGIMAYWAEGSKTLDSLVQFTNADPDFIKFALRWLREVCDVKEAKLRVHLRIHPDVDKKTAEDYWAKVTNIPLTQFHKTTAKVSGSGGRKYNKLGNGIATITVCDTNLYYKIIGWIEGLKSASL
jgi:hypothetical protein